MSWVADYSLKFDKCATTNEYYGGYFGGNNNGQNQGQNNNNNNNRNGYNGLYEQRLVHFKLCPTSTCGKGCTGGADYVVDMNEYVTTYFEYKAELLRAKCETAKANCVCDNADDGDNADGGDDADAEDGGEDAETVSTELCNIISIYLYIFVFSGLTHTTFLHVTCFFQTCYSACYVAAGLTYSECQEEGQQNNNNNNGQQQQYVFNMEEASRCSRLEIDEDAAAAYYNYGANNAYNNYNNYNQNNNQNNQNNKIEFFVGPYCAATGRSIFLGVFMDETCSYAAPEGVFTKLTGGQTLPYSTTSLIGHDCLSCTDTSAADDANAEVQYDENGNVQVQVLEMCQTLYEGSGKCETNLAVNGHYPTTYACDFIKGLNAWGKTRIAAEYQEFASHVTPQILAGVFACTTLLFGIVSYHIHSKMSSGGRKQAPLVQDGVYIEAADSRYAA